MEKVITGTSAADNIKVWESGVTVNAGAGNDTIHLTKGTDSTVNGQEGNDTIYIHAGAHTVYGGAGDDVMVTWGNAGDGSRFEGRTGDDSFKIKGGNNHVIITGDGSLNTINLDKGSGHSITGGNTGVDRLFICSDDVTNITANLQNGENRATLWGGSDNTITGGGDTDIFNVKGGMQNRLYGGAGKDYLIIHTGEQNSVYGGSGDDRLTIWQNSGDKNNLYGEDGNDTIEVNGGNDHRIDGGEGYNTVKLKGGDRHTYTGGSGKDIVYISGGDGLTVSAGDGENRITVYSGTGHVITGGENGDIIDIKGGSNSEITAGNGTDYITISGGTGHKVDGGDGNDIIKVTGGENHQLYGGAGDDNLYGGAGDDNLYGGEGKDVFWCDSGNDTIYDFESGRDTIRLPSANIKKCETFGNDAVLTLSNGGKITVKNMAGQTIDYIDSVGNSLSVSSQVTQQSVIKSFMKYLDDYPTLANTRKTADIVLDEAVNYASNSVFPTWNSLIECFISDVRTYGGSESDIVSGTNDLIEGTTLDNFLKNYCGINLFNDDTGAITGADAGGPEIKTPISVVPENGGIEDLQSPNFTEDSMEFTVNGLTFRFNPETYDSNNEDQKYIVDNLYTWWAEEGLKLNEESFGLSFTEEGVTGNVIDVNLVTEDSRYMAYVNTNYNTKSETTKLTMKINMKYFDDIDKTGVDGLSTTSNAYLDRTIAHELTHAVMGATMAKVYTPEMPLYLREGLAELTRGIDDLRTGNIVDLARIDNADYLEQDLFLPYADKKEYTYTGGYMLMRYFAKQSAENYGNAINSSSFNITISNSVSDSIASAASLLWTEDLSAAAADTGSELASAMTSVSNALFTPLNGSGTAVFGTDSLSPGLFTENTNNGLWSN